MKPRYIIGDVHGCFDTLMALLKKLPKEADASNTIFLGDLIDRGPKSRQVVEFIREGGYQCVIGNHCQMMKEGLEQAETGLYNDMYDTWVYNGGDKCLKSYEGHAKQMKKDIEWFDSLPLYLTFDYPEGTKDLLLSHAPSVTYFERMISYQKQLAGPWNELTPISRDVMNSDVNAFFGYLTWNRNVPKTGSEKYFGVSGHNVWNIITEADHVTKCLIDENFASIDTGVCFDEIPYAILTAMEYPSMKLFQQPLVDPIEPRKQPPARTHAW